MVTGPPRVPRAYQPPLPRKPQVVESARTRGRRGWLLLPLIGLIPVVAAVVASEWPFGSGAGSPNAPRAAAPGTTVVTTVSATSTTPALTTQAIPAPAVATSAPTAAIGFSAPGAAAAPTPGTAAAGAATASASGSTAIQASTSPATGPFTAYRVQPGDTVKFVAEMYGVSPASVSNASGLHNPARLQVGQLLTIPNQSR